MILTAVDSEGLKDVHREDNGTTDEFYKRLRARINGPLGDRSLGPSTVSDTTEVELPVGEWTLFVFSKQALIASARF